MTAHNIHADASFASCCMRNFDHRFSIFFNNVFTVKKQIWNPGRLREHVLAKLQLADEVKAWQDCLAASLCRRLLNVPKRFETKT